VTCAFDFLAELGCFFFGEGRSGNSGGDFFNKKKALFQVVNFFNNNNKIFVSGGDCFLFKK
jgi:hypothetical protein